MGDRVFPCYPLPLPILLVLAFLSPFMLVFTFLFFLHVPSFWGSGFQAYFSWILYVGFICVFFLLLFLGSLTSVVHRFLFPSYSLIALSFVFFYSAQFTLGPLLLFLTLIVWMNRVWSVLLIPFFVVAIMFLYVFCRRGGSIAGVRERMSHLERLYLSSGYCSYARGYYGAEASYLRRLSGDDRRAYLSLKLCAMAIGGTMLSIAILGRFYLVGSLLIHVVCSVLAMVTLLPEYFFLRVPLFTWLKRLKLAWRGELRMVTAEVAEKEPRKGGVSLLYVLIGMWGRKEVFVVLAFIGLGLASASIDMHNLKGSLKSPFVTAGFTVSIVGLLWYRLYTMKVLAEAEDAIAGKTVYLKPLQRKPFLFSLVSLIYREIPDSWKTDVIHLVNGRKGGFEEAVSLLSAYLPLTIKRVDRNALLVGINMSLLDGKHGKLKLDILKLILDLVESNIAEIHEIL